MHAFNLDKEQAWDLSHHVEKILGKIADGDVTVACWEPGQISPYHCHPDATEIYFCYQGGGKMRTPREAIDVVPGSFVVHPQGDLHEYINGAQRTLLFRVRYGASMHARRASWDTRPGWKQSEQDIEFFARYPQRLSAEAKPEILK